MLAEHGKTNYRIVMAHPAHETVKYACDELHDFFYQITGASLPVTTELIPSEGPELLVGGGERLNALGIRLSREALGEEGYTIRTVGDTIVMAGTTPRATLYAVYAFLEQLGCRWFTKDVSHIPVTGSLPLPVLDVVDKPAFESRETYWREAFDGDFAVRNRLNSNKADISARQGGCMKFYNFHHSFEDLVPPETYFKTHPEYFSLVDGKRLKTRSQLCLTNPDVLSIAIQRVRQWIRENPDCRVFSVAQNDWDNHCTCPDCMRIEEREASPSGPILWFVNQIAENIAEDYPDILLHTFAYQYSRKAPRTIRPHPNVIVRLCDIECCFSHPLDGVLRDGVRVKPEEEQKTHSQCATRGETLFLRDLREWSAICDHLYVWDYVTDFAHYLAPFPNLDVLQRNLQLFHSMGVSGVLEQGDFAHGGGGNMSEMQVYLQAKLLWNPDCDLERCIVEFLRGYYGAAAAPLIREYLMRWQEAVSPWHMGIGEGPDAPYITDTLLQQADSLLNRALFATKEPAEHQRIEKLRLGITYLLLCRMPPHTPGRDALIDRFGWQLRAQGISEIHERWSLEEALELMKQAVYSRDKQQKLRVDYKM